MIKHEHMSSLVEDFVSSCPECNQATFYPNIIEESVKQVSEKFPEFDINNETPLLYCWDGSRFISTPRWMMLTDLRLYYYLDYFPEKFDALNCIKLSNINSFRMMYNKWKQDYYVEINNKKVGSLDIKNKNEKASLSNFINLVVNHTGIQQTGVEKSEQYFDETLENAELFSTARDYFDEVNRGGRLWEFKDFYYGSFIPERKQADWQDYANFDVNKEKPILFIDNSSIRVETFNVSGVVVTNKNLYYKLHKAFGDKKFSIGMIPFSEIDNFQIKIKFSGWMVINDGRWKLLLTRFVWVDKREAQVIQNLMQKLIKKLNETN